ncbi:MAG: hypothetical protein AB7O39_06250 [Flavobacteriaceae bacterium]
MSSRLPIVLMAVAAITTGCAATPDRYSGPAALYVGTSLDTAARAEASAAEYRALETGAPGVPETWRAPNGQAYGEVIAGHPYEARGLLCRDYSYILYVSDRPEVGRGTACRQPDGTWRRTG